MKLLGSFAIAPLVVTSAFAVALAVAVASTGCGGRNAHAKITARVPADVINAGKTVYFGKVFPLRGSGASPLFVYERRVAKQANGVVSAHITRDVTGAVVFADSATHTPSYRLTDYTLHTNQMGQSGGVHVQGDQVAFRLNDGGKERERVETQSAPVVVGPTLVGHIHRNLADLATGRRLPVRFAVLDRMETIGFDLEAVNAPAGQTRIRMKASNFLVAAVMDPFYFTFDAASGKLIRLEGRVPPKTRDGRKLRDLDARVEYQFVAAAYE